MWRDQVCELGRPASARRRSIGPPRERTWRKSKKDREGEAEGGFAGKGKNKGDSFERLLWAWIKSKDG